ncbi:MAG: hypothetical protein AAB840_02425 [Patescibacteria group bacterium]
MFQSKRILSSAFLAIILVGGGFVLSRGETPSKKSAGEVKKANYAISEIDTDGDGLKDWEERLWRTDINNKDTDGDGTSDGDEVVRERDPLVLGPDDSLKSTAISANSVVKNAVDNEDLNFSESFSRFVFSSYVNSKINNSAPFADTGSLDALVSAKLPPAKVYLMTDLSVSSSESADSFKSYANMFAEVLLANANSGAGSELAVLATAFSNDDRKELEKLDPIIKNLGATLSSLLDVGVPESVAGKHLAFINALSSTKYDIELMKTAYDDPMVAFLAINGYRGDSEKTAKALEDIKQAVKEKGVVFGEAEAGYKIFK